MPQLAWLGDSDARGAVRRNLGFRMTTPFLAEPVPGAPPVGARGSHAAVYLAPRAYYPCQP